MEKDQSNCSSNLSNNADEKQQKDSLTRRDFFSSASTGGIVLGAGLLMSAAPQPLWAAPAKRSPTSKAGHASIPLGWSNAFHPAATAPLYPPRQAPKAGEKVHEFDIEHEARRNPPP